MKMSELTPKEKLMARIAIDAFIVTLEDEMALKYDDEFIVKDLSCVVKTYRAIWDKLKD